MQGSSVVSKTAEGAYGVGRSEDSGCFRGAGGKDIVNRWEAARNERQHERVIASRHLYIYNSTSGSRADVAAV